MFLRLFTCWAPLNERRALKIGCVARGKVNERVVNSRVMPWLQPGGVDTTRVGETFQTCLNTEKRRHRALLFAGVLGTRKQIQEAGATLEALERCNARSAAPAPWNH